VGVGSLKQKCRANLAAIELLKRLEAEGRAPTAEEKRALVRYVGWGGLPQVFDNWNDEWKEERERLERLLTPDELESARATTLNAHYTAPGLIRAMYAMLQRLGFASGRILEPACGLGHFIGLMPEEVLDTRASPESKSIPSRARLAKLLYPTPTFANSPSRNPNSRMGFFDVAIGNIPFGDYKPFDPRFKHWHFVIHDYFFAATLEKVRPGGLISFITSRGTLGQNGWLAAGIPVATSRPARRHSPAQHHLQTQCQHRSHHRHCDFAQTAASELPSGPAWREIEDSPIRSGRRFR